MVLEEDRALGIGERSRDRGGSGEVLVEFQIFVHQHTIEPHRDPSPCGPFAFGIELRGGEVDIIRLPSERRQAHVEARFGD